MGVDTKAILVSNPNHEEVAQAITEAFGSVPEIRTGVALRGEAPTHFILTFPDPVETDKDRMLHVFTKTMSDYEDVYTGPATSAMLGMWGQSVQIMEALARKFGGFVCDSDFTGDWRVVDRVTEEGAAEPTPLAPADELNLALSRFLPAEQAIEIRKVSQNPHTLAQVMAAFDAYRARSEAAAAA